MKDKMFWLEDYKTTVWHFPNDYPTRDPIHGVGNYPGRFAPSIPRLLIKKYSRENDLIIDPFVGSGTTAVEAKKANRNFIGMDINHEAIKLTEKKLALINTKPNQICKVILADAKKLFLEENSVDLIITSPPFFNLIKFNESEYCLSNAKNLDEYKKQLTFCFEEMNRVLKKEKWCCIVISDSIKGWNFYPLGYHIQSILEKVGFTIQRVIIHIQSRTDSFLFGNDKVKDKVLERGLFLIAHEYIILSQKKNLL